MMNDKAKPSAIVTVLLAAVVGVVTALIVYAFLVEYGPTTGSRVDGALRGLLFGAVGLVIAGALAAAAFYLGKGSAWVRRLAIVAIVLSVGGVVVGGAHAAVVKYDGLPKVPNCGVADYAGTPAVRAIQDAYAGLAHPAPFGAGWNGISGCGADLLNVSFAEAAAHYRVRLPAAGWSIMSDTGSELTARRADLVFTLAARCGPASVTIKLANAEGNTRC